jgi:hypothetical protein
VSGKVTGAVWEMDLPRPVKYLLLALAEHANHDGEQIHPGIDLLAWKTGYAARNVQRMLRELEAMGVIVPEQGMQGGRGKVVHYAIDFDAAPKLPVRKRPERVKSPHTTGVVKGDIPAQKGETSAQERVTSPRIKGETSAQPAGGLIGGNRTVKEPSLGTVLEPGEGDGAMPRRRSATPPSPMPDGFQLTPERRRFAEERGLAGDRVEVEWQKFVAHHESRGNRLADWDAGWRKWVLKVPEFGGGTRGHGGGAANGLDRAARAKSELDGILKIARGD